MGREMRQDVRMARMDKINPFYPEYLKNPCILLNGQEKFDRI